jgi:hypothetical protein
MHRSMITTSPKSDKGFDQPASAAAFFFLRQPRSPSAPRRVANSGSAVGSGADSQKVGLNRVCEFIKPAREDQSHFNGTQRCAFMQECFRGTSVSPQ